MIQFIDSISTILFSIFGIAVAGLVYELNRQKFRLDLLEKRNEALNEFQCCLDIYLEYGEIPVKFNEPDSPHKRAIHHARLFRIKSRVLDSNCEKLADDLIEFVMIQSGYNRTIETLKLKNQEGTDEWNNTFDKMSQSYDEYEKLFERANNFIIPLVKISEPPALKTLLFPKHNSN